MPELRLRNILYHAGIMGYDYRRLFPLYPLYELPNNINYIQREGKTKTKVRGFR